MYRTSNLIGLATLILVAAGPVLAQQATGNLKGRIADNRGNPKDGVRITILNPGTGFTRTSVSDANGLFTFVALPVGSYDMTYTLGTTTFKASRNVVLGQDTIANFLKWPTANQSTTVEVVAEAPADIIDTASAQVGTTVSFEMINSLPVVSRDINEAAVLAPGVQIVQGSNVDPTKKASSYITTGDGMGRGTSFAVDGADNNSTDVGGYVLPVPMDAISQFQVVTNQYKAEFGRSTAGFFNVVTKSGTNEFAGLLTSQYTTQAMRARRTDEGVKSDDNKGIYAATVSGPIMKDKVFFMISAERQQGVGKAYDFQPYSTALYPALGAIKQEIGKKTVYAKVDWNMAQNAQLNLNYGYNQDLVANQGFPRTTAFNGNVPPAALGTSADRTWATGARFTWNINNSTVLESHYSYFDYINGIHPKELGPGNGTPMALTDATFPNAPRPDQQNLGWGGIDPNALQNTGIKRAEWKNELTYLVDNHALKAGLDYQRTTYADQVLFFGETGLYTTIVGGVGVNYATGWAPGIQADQNVTSARFVANGAQAGISFKQYGIYLQDDWNINANWSVYLGVRLDWDTQLDYLKERFSNIYAAVHQYSPTLAGMDGTAPEGKKYFEPRLQALYRPKGDDSLVFKFGAGRFVANVIDNVTGFSRGMSNPVNGLPNRIRNNAARAFLGQGADTVYPVPSFKAGTNIGTVNGHTMILPADLTPYNYANNVGGLRDYFRVTVNSWLTAATPDTDGKSLISSDFQYPTTDAFNVGVAYRINDRSAIDVTLLYSKSRHLTSQTANGSDGSGPLTTEFDSQGNPLGDVIFYSNQTASSKQLQFKYSYTRPNTSIIASLVIKDMKSSEGGAAGAFDASGSTGGLYGEGARYPFQTSPERTSPGTEHFAGSFQISHRFSFGTGVSLLANWHSGKAYDVIQLYNNVLGPNASVDYYHPQEVLGTEYGRWNMDMNLRVSHSFVLSKRVSVEPYIVVQNLLNNYDYGSNYDGNKFLNDGTFNAGDGTATSGFGHRGPAYQTNNPRNFAVGARLVF